MNLRRVQKTGAVLAASVCSVWILSSCQSPPPPPPPPVVVHHTHVVPAPKHIHHKGDPGKDAGFPIFEPVRDTPETIKDPSFGKSGG